MWITHTLSYPYILLDRQLVLRKYCAGKGVQDFSTNDFGFRIVVPKEYCVLPHRTFPKDTSIQIVPTGNYSVINEYAKGSIINAAKATILFEHASTERSPEELIAKMTTGGFFRDATITQFTNKNNLRIYLMRNTLGIDGVSHFDWAFIMHPNGKTMLTMLTAHPESPDVFNYIFENLEPLQ